MALIGCTNPAAENYDPEAVQDDGSCVYLVSMNGQCLEFGDVDLVTSIEDRSYTLSYDFVDKKWSFYHDYFPDYYIHTRKSLYSTHNSVIHEHNRGPRGLYYDRSNAKPFILDVVFSNKETTILNSVNWISEVRAGGNKEADENSIALYEETISAITIWNNYQCTGRIVLDENNPPLLIANNRNSEQTWSFNDFRNVAIENTQFLEDIFKNYAVKLTAIDLDLPWYKKRLMDGKYFIVRFEFINSGDRQITLHDVDIDADISYRA